MEDDRVAPVVSWRHEGLALPSQAAVSRCVHAADIVARADLVKSNAPENEMPGVGRVDGDGSNSARESRSLRRRREMPGLAGVEGLIDADPRIGIGG